MECNKFLYTTSRDSGSKSREVFRPLSKSSFLGHFLQKTPLKMFGSFLSTLLACGPVDTRRCFNVYKTSYRRLIDVETTS